MNKVYGIGLNDRLSVKDSLSYIRWLKILHKVSVGHSTICEDWLLFSKFDDWFTSNYLDGFIISNHLFDRGNKHYSPETTYIVPRLLSGMISRNSNPPKFINTNTNKGYRVLLHKYNKCGSEVVGYTGSIEQANELWRLEHKKYCLEVISKCRGYAVLTELLDKLEEKIVDLG